MGRIPDESSFACVIICDMIRKAGFLEKYRFYVSRDRLRSHFPGNHCKFSIMRYRNAMLAKLVGFGRRRLHEP